ncbi:hypothetical protein ACI3L1_01410 [Deinococcus sp. SM5_A1]|uniref:hypothetical protein n=1 Tax=Deinococcus sp. SM5_A1 TaxID=3379094 RepID=UPI00385DC13D
MKIDGSPHQTRLEAALPAVLKRIAATPGVYAALWCGSAARGEANAYSDLDFHALVSGDHRWRSNFMVDGVPVEVFHNPVRKVRAMLAAEDAATITMFAQGRAVLPHPDLDALMAEARALYAAGPTPRPVSPSTQFMLVDAVMDARASRQTPVHALTVMAALGPLVMRPLYAAGGWWDVKREHWLDDLEAKAPAVAQELRLVLGAATDDARQEAFEVLARRLTGQLEYTDGGTEPEPVP